MDKTVTPSLQWGDNDLLKDTIHHISLGTLSVWIKQSPQELSIASHRCDSNVVHSIKPNDVPQNITWSRWATKKAYPQLRMLPRFPDRPIVVKPESTFILMKGAQARIYVKVPLWVQFLVGVRPPVTLIELPSVILSNTWFGTFFEGEACYWISSSARIEPAWDDQKPFLAICPLQLQNNSDDDLQVEKICLRVSGLSLFKHGDQLWADETKIHYAGLHESSAIETRGVPPAEAPEAKLLSPARIPMKKGLAAKTFASLKDLSTYGMTRS
ncbi:hypothetical protein JW960_26290 [candidate division KSB1 bacterium]|nr:hypothetical protein [candidate division KSB1 bacterium]